MQYNIMSLPKILQTSFSVTKQVFMCDILILPILFIHGQQIDRAYICVVTKYISTIKYVQLAPIQQSTSSFLYFQLLHVTNLVHPIHSSPYSMRNVLRRIIIFICIQSSRANTLSTTPTYNIKSCKLSQIWANAYICIGPKLT